MTPEITKTFEIRDGVWTIEVQLDGNLVAVDFKQGEEYLIPRATALLLAQALGEVANS